MGHDVTVRTPRYMIEGSDGTRCHSEDTKIYDRGIGWDTMSTDRETVDTAKQTPDRGRVGERG